MAFSGSLNFITASDWGFASRSGPDQWTWGNSADGGAPGFLPTDFVGLNTIILEPIT